MGMGVVKRKKKLTRFTDNGRAEQEIESIFLSKYEADEQYQRVRTFAKTPKLDDLNDGEMAKVEGDSGLEFYTRHGRTLYRLNAEKVE